MINEEARVDSEDNNTPQNKTSSSALDDDIFGDGSGETPAEMDYSKPFRLFDEKDDGVIPVDRFRIMLYRLHVNSLLRERQVVALIDRFDVERTGERDTSGTTG